MLFVACVNKSQGIAYLAERKGDNAIFFEHVVIKCGGITALFYAVAKI
jgi:hypothetical protein